MVYWNCINDVWKLCELSFVVFSYGKQNMLKDKVFFPPAYSEFIGPCGHQQGAIQPAALFVPTNL